MLAGIGIGIAAGTLVFDVLKHLRVRPSVRSLEVNNERVRIESVHGGQVADGDKVYIEARVNVQTVISDDVGMNIGGRVKPSGRSWDDESVVLGQKHLDGKAFDDDVTLGGYVHEIQTKITKWDLEISVIPTGGRQKTREFKKLALLDGRPESSTDA